MSKSKEPPETETGEGLDLGGETSSTEKGNTPPADNDAVADNGGQDTLSEKKDGEKKIGLVTFVQLTEPNRYVVSMLKNKHGMEVHTKKEWEQIVEDLLKKKVS